MRQTRLLRRRRARRDDAEVAIDLHGIGVDGGAAEPLRERKGKGRLAAAGRPCPRHGLARLHQRNHPKNTHKNTHKTTQMSLVATLICNPANPALDSTIVDGALAVLPSPGTARWLFDEVAVDIPFTSREDVRVIEARLREAR